MVEYPNESPASNLRVGQGAQTMIKRVTTALLLFVLSALVPITSMASTAPAAITVWTQGTATKVQPTTAPESGNTIVLEGARPIPARDIQDAHIKTPPHQPNLRDVIPSACHLSSLAASP